MFFNYLIIIANVQIMPIIPKAFGYIATAFFSLVVGVYLNRLKNRLTLLSYTINMSPLATAAKDEYWGDIKVFHNNREINHLCFCNIVIENNTSKDLDNFLLEVICDQNSSFIGQNGFYFGTQVPIILESAFNTLMEKTIKEIETDNDYKAISTEHTTSKELVNNRNHIYTRRFFDVEVLNRQTIIHINLLIENTNSTTPTINLYTKKKGVKIIKKIDEAEEIKKLILYTFIYGVVSLAIGIYIITYFFPASTMPVIYTGAIGLLYSFIGLAIYKSIDLIRKLFS